MIYLFYSKILYIKLELYFSVFFKTLYSWVLKLIDMIFVPDEILFGKYEACSEFGKKFGSLI